MKTIKGFRLDGDYNFRIEQNDLRIDPNKLPIEIKQKALEDCKQNAILADAWLRGFAFCLEGQVTVKVRKLEEKGDWVVRNKEPL